MRTTILSLTTLTLTLTLAACGGAGQGEHYIGSEHGQHFGDDSWIDDPIYWKAGALAVFPLSAQGPFVAAGDEMVAFQPAPTRSLMVRGTPVPDVTLLPTGAIEQHGRPLGYVVYIQLEDETLGTALVSTSGRTLEVLLDGAGPRLAESDALLALAGAESAPLNDAGLPVAQPAD